MVKQVMKEQGISQSYIAEMLGVSIPAVHYVVASKKRIPRLRKAIAFLLSKPEAELWPDTLSSDT